MKGRISVANFSQREKFNVTLVTTLIIKRLPILVTERGARSWSRCTLISPQVIISHPPDGKLPSASPAVTFPAAEHRLPLAGTKLYCLVTEARRCEQLSRPLRSFCPE